jgi:hypothetical protein
MMPLLVPLLVLVALGLTLPAPLAALLDRTMEIVSK